MSQPFRPTRLVALLIAAPAVIVALGLGAIEGYGLVRPASSLDSGLPAGSFADAILNGEVEQAYAFVRAGQDPNTAIAFSHPDLTGDREIMISPLLLAVATHNRNVVMMLLSFGVRMELPGNRLAVCLANRLGYEEIAGIIVRDGRPASGVTCPQPRPEPLAPLLAFVE